MDTGMWIIDNALYGYTDYPFACIQRNAFRMIRRSGKMYHSVCVQNSVHLEVARLTFWGFVSATGVTPLMAVRIQIKDVDHSPHSGISRCPLFGLRVERAFSPNLSTNYGSCTVYCARCNMTGSQGTNLMSHKSLC
ncbi:hypothetical protein AVEN_63185-1 [Araneus ventricosus]|uniref:Uncharacterized protein n=1 Tax=Araneus ventricosus TaxID=182803 RepID=A0A4Y2B3H9_ARAVE|nr:hypothetical protein AVEN_63185-1 [Araneus ventricosus]